MAEMRKRNEFFTNMFIWGKKNLKRVSLYFHSTPKLHKSNLKH